MSVAPKVTVLAWICLMPPPLIAQTVAGLLLVGVRPFRIDRERERRTRSGDVGGERRRRCGDQAGSDDSFHEIHAGLHLVSEAPDTPDRAHAGPFRSGRCPFYEG